MHTPAPAPAPTGAAFEGALRKQHAQLHPRTSWAALGGGAGGGRRRRVGGVTGDDAGVGGEGEGSSEDEEGEGVGALLGGWRWRWAVLCCMNSCDLPLYLVCC